MIVTLLTKYDVWEIYVLYPYFQSGFGPPKYPSVSFI